MAAESHILDGLALNDNVVFQLADVPVFTPAPQRVEMVGSVDSDGSIPADAGHSDNSTLVLPLRVKKQATADLAWTKLGLLLAKLEAVRRSASGLTHVWTPKDMTSAWLLTVRGFEITEFPMNDRDNLMGYLRRFPRITITLHCDPFLYKQGQTLTFGPTTSALPVFSLSMAAIPGHVDAEATLTVTDAASQPRQHVEGGLGEDSAAGLLIDSASLSVLGGASTTRTGAYASSGVIRATLAAQAQAVCATGNLGHVGVHRPKARIWASSTAVRLRLAYRTGDGPYSYTPWVTPPLAGDFSEVAFGTVTIRGVTNGTQRWDGRIEAYSATVGDTLDIDTFMMLPADRYWSGRFAYRYQAGVLVARDEFTGITAGAALNGRSAPAGTWTTSGATTDFTGFVWPGSGAATIRRTTTADTAARVALIGASVADTEAGVWLLWSTAAANITMQLRVRNGVNGYLAAYLRPVSPYFFLAHTSGAGATQYVPVNLQSNVWYRLRVVAFTSGHAIGTLMSADGATIAEIQMNDPVLAAGGALASGTAGLGDFNDSGTAVSRYYDNFYAATPPTEQLVINPGRQLQIRHDGAERQSADGTTWAPLVPRGGRLFVPCAGAEGRTPRLWIKARRNDVETMADSGITDSTTATVTVRPRYRMPTN